MAKVAKVALIGGGVIGAGWAARLLINGIDVVVCDPSPEVERRLQEVADNALRAYRKMTLAPIALQGTLSFESDLTKAVSDVDFVQESGPERLDIKQQIFTTVCANTGPEVVIASSSSGLLPSDIQADVAHPERVLIGHPFNPVYLMPLVEIVGGKLTDQVSRDKAADFYRQIGMHPLQVRKEIDAFLADRMMEALWREALHLVNEGIATTDEIDQAISYGPGLRWAFMGSFLTYRIAGGEGGMRHFMEQFGPSLKWPWTRFDGPDLSDELLDNIETQSDEQAQGMGTNELEHLRDDCLVSVLQGLRGQNYGAGAVLKSYEEKLYEVGHQAVMHSADEITAPLQIHQDVVHQEWVDYNGHMTESRYLQVFGDASDALFRFIGIDADYHQQGFSFYTVETHICHLLEVAAGAPLRVTTQLIDHDEKRIHVLHSILEGESGDCLATAEQMLLHVDTNAASACPAREDIQQRIAAIAHSHATMTKPKQAGRAIGIKPKG